MPTPLAHDDPVTLGPYRLVARLGSGGMGTVYMARGVGGRTVALKTTHARIATDPGIRARFRLEVDAARVIGDRFGARVVDADPFAETPWLATEFVLGPALDETVLGTGPLPERSVRALGAALCSALDQLHRSDVVHRDLKPSNILLTAYGPKVIDFGIARPEHGLTLTTTCQTPVTPGYGAPEQVLGRRVTPAADVFSLGAVLAYALTGQRAFEGSHVAVVQYAVVHGEPRLDGVEPQLRALVEPCLAKDPAARPQPAEIVRAMDVSKRADRAWKRGRLADAIKERETGAARMTTDATAQLLRARRALTRRRLLAGLSTTGVVVAAGGGTTAWLLGTTGGSTGGGPKAAPSPFRRRWPPPRPG
ncbi:serine/threonine-protein kinase [Streptomyces hokutonensis]|uniref:serine/threonine-protein kinase n=1 Tax=Streptomyces hokutonensis TaxID=1306990 RepID=UPI0003795572|nr:serine/threonine-protein kinase [Streptomyces hokutonensis]